MTNKSVVHEYFLNIILHIACILKPLQSKDALVKADTLNIGDKSMKQCQCTMYNKITLDPYKRQSNITQIYIDSKKDYYNINFRGS